MFLSLLTAASICSSMRIETRLSVNLDKLAKRSCVESSDIVFTGELSRGKWQEVHLSGGVFQEVGLGTLKWVNSRVRNSYWRGLKSGEVLFSGSEVSALRSVGSIWNTLALDFSSGGNWLIDRNTMSELKLVNSSIKESDWSVVAIDSLTVEGGELIGARFVNSSLAKVHISGARLDGFKLESSELGALVLSEVRADAVVVKAIDPTSLELNKTILANSDFSEVNWSDARLTGAQFHGGSIRNSTGFLNATILDSRFQGISFSNVAIDLSHFENTLFRSVAFDNVSARATRFVNVHFEASDLRGLEILTGTTFENCTYDSATLTDWDETQLPPPGLRLK